MQYIYALGFLKINPNKFVKIHLTYPLRVSYNISVNSYSLKIAVQIILNVFNWPFYYFLT